MKDALNARIDEFLKANKFDMPMDQRVHMMIAAGRMIRKLNSFMDQVHDKAVEECESQDEEVIATEMQKTFVGLPFDILFLTHQLLSDMSQLILISDQLDHVQMVAAMKNAMVEDLLNDEHEVLQDILNMLMNEGDPGPIVKH